MLALKKASRSPLAWAVFISAAVALAAAAAFPADADHFFIGIGEPPRLEGWKQITIVPSLMLVALWILVLAGSAMMSRRPSQQG